VRRLWPMTYDATRRRVLGRAAESGTSCGTARLKSSGEKAGCRGSARAGRQARAGGQGRAVISGGVMRGGLRATAVWVVGEGGILPESAPMYDMRIICVVNSAVSCTRA
jgi:hypothetical protein